jgi:hypothetical protein
MIDQFRKGELDANAKVFTPQPNPERAPVDVEPEEVVNIIKKDCRSMVKEVDRTKRREEIKYMTTATNSSQKVLTHETVENYEEINVRCEDNLRKVTEVKPERKRGNFKNFEKRKKFQAIVKQE